MKKFSFILAAFCLGTLLLGSCNSDKSVATTATETCSAVADTAATTGNMAGIDHSKMAESATAGNAGMMAVMKNIEAFKPEGKGHLFRPRPA